MFKKLFLASVAALSFSFVMAAPANSNEVETEEQSEVKGIHPFKPQENASDSITHVSLFLTGGFNVFDGDFTSEQKHAVYAPTVGLGVEYHFNSTWGLALQYQFRQHAVFGKSDRDAEKLLKGMMHQASGYITFDIFNCWRPQNKYKLFALNLLLGGGAAWWKNEIQFPAGKYKTLADGTRIWVDDLNKYRTAEQTPDKMGSYKCVGVFFGGAEFEFNVSRSVSVGIKAVYNYFANDKVDGRILGNNNDGIFDCEAILRYKIDAEKHSHIRNMCHESRVAPKQQPQEVIPATPGKDTVIIIHKDTVVLNQVINQVIHEVEAQEPDYFIYFKNDKHDITPAGLVTVHQVGSRMQRENNDECAVIIGYCDNTNTSEYNKALSARRANNVAKELNTQYGIDKSRLMPIGRGILEGRDRGSYGPNRRVEVHMMSRADFDNIQNQFAQISEQEMNNMLKDAEEVTVEEGVTLSRLARRFYDNTDCWVYIYLANRDVMASPNALEEGTVLLMPTLTPEQKMITKEQAERLLNNMTSKQAE